MPKFWGGMQVGFLLALVLCMSEAPLSAPVELYQYYVVFLGFVGRSVLCAEDRRSEVSSEGASGSGDLLGDLRERANRRVPMGVKGKVCLNTS